MRLKKPIIVVLDGSKHEFKRLVNECKLYCGDDDTQLRILFESLERNPFPWLDEDEFSAKALN